MSIMVSSASSRSFIQKRPAPTFPRRRRGPHGPASSSVQTAESRPSGFHLQTGDIRKLSKSWISWNDIIIRSNGLRWSHSLIAKVQLPLR